MKYIATFFTLFILAVIFLANRGQLGPIARMYDFPYGDKVGHFVLFGLLSFFLTLTFLRALPNRNPKLVALSMGLVLALLIGAEEYSQKFFEKRTFDLIDLTA